MSKYRRGLSIIVDILKATEKVGKKTRIMYLANLSYDLLQKYLGESISVGFIESSNNGYEVTEKGRAFLEKYKRYRSRYSRVQKTLRNLTREREDLERMCQKCADGANPKTKGKKEIRNEKRT
jgi:predicted transcriptional regulator